jgi:putative ABC transport system permease protein
MSAADFLRLTLRSLAAHRLRSALTLTGIAVGIAAVILLTSLGEGLHRYVLHEFTQFGTNIVQITPGRREASGGPPGLPSSARPLTLDDAAALARLPDVTGSIPAVSGNSEVRAGSRVRRTMVLGTGARMDRVFSLPVASGRFLPDEDAGSARAVAVLGAKLAHELFGEAGALGERVRIGDERYRVIGVMAAKGQFLGFDLDDMIYIPATRALALYDREGLMEINLAYREGADPARIAESARALLAARHGQDDVTVQTQEDMIATLSNILGILTAAVGALGGISLLVGGVGIVTIMTIAVSERTNEIGLLKALGARGHTILALFLGEAVVLAALGGALGLVAGIGIAQLAALLVPALPVHTPLAFVVGAETLAVAIGAIAGVLPASRAARLDPVEALRAE